MIIILIPNTVQKCQHRLFFLFAVGETASNLGTAMDELMRHQPTLKTDAMTAIIKVFYYALHSHKL